MAIATVLSAGIFCLAVIMALVQIWFVPLDWMVFTKLMMSAGALIVMAFGVGMAVREFKENKKLKERGYLD